MYHSSLCAILLPQDLPSLHNPDSLTVMGGQRAGPIVTFLDVWEDLSTKDVGFDKTLTAM